MQSPGEPERENGIVQTIHPHSRAGFWYRRPVARLIPIKLADEIRERYALGVAGRGARSVARRYGVSVRTVQRVTHGPGKAGSGGRRRRRDGQAYCSR
jgi:hypothetical protein